MLLCLLDAKMRSRSSDQGDGKHPSAHCPNGIPLVVFPLAQRFCFDKVEVLTRRTPAPQLSGSETNSLEVFTFEDGQGPVLWWSRGAP